MIRSRRYPDLKRPFLVFLLGVILTLAASAFYADVLTATKAQRLRANAALVERAIENRINIYVSMLRATAALFALQPGLSRAQFAQYTANLDVRRRFPGIQGIGYSKRSSKAQLDQVVADVRQSGLPEFHVFPDHERDDYYPIVYLEPLDARNRAAVGYDMFTEPVRRQAMERARDTAEAAATGVVTLKQEIEEKKQAGFLIYYPVYRGGRIPATVEERRADLLGFVYSPFRAEDLFQGIFKDAPRQIEFTIIDGAPPTEGAVLHRSSVVGSSEAAELRHDSVQNIVGRPWRIIIYPGTGFAVLLAGGARGVALVGLVLTTLITALVGSEAWRRQVAEASAREIRDERERYQTTLASLADSVIATDLDGRISFMNSAAEKTTGWTLAEAKGHPAARVFTLVDEPSGEVVDSPIEAALGRHRDAGRELLLTKRDGTRIPINSSASPILTYDGTRVGSALVFRDMSGARKTQRALERLSSESAETAALLESLLENAPIGFAFFDRNLRYVRINNALAEMNGLRIEDHIGRSIAEILPSAADIIEPILRNVFEDRQVRRAVEVTGRLVRDQQTRSYLCGFFPVIPASASSVELVGIVTSEITERMHMEAQIRESERRFRELADAMPQMVWITDADGRVEYLNHQWAALTGTVVDAAEPPDWLAPVHPDDLKRAQTQWKKCIEEGVSFEGELRFAKSGQSGYRWFLCRAVPVRGAARQILRWFGTCTEIEGQKRAEAERDLLLASERAARSEVERASRMKDEFLATLSHELRTPINAVLGWAQLLRLPNRSDEDIEEGLETIERNSRVQAQLIEDLLDMSRIISGKVAFQVSELSIDSVVQEAVDSVRHTASAKGVELSVESEPNPTRLIVGDPARLQQIFWNLLTNAIKFTPPGGKVSASIDEEPSQSVVQIRDTGQGIRPEFLPYVFDRFRQADASTTRKHGGLGLGLAIVRNLVELHGGSVQAESLGEGQGSTFTVFLPMSEKKSLPQISKAVGEALDRSGLAGLEVLIVDDEPDALRLTKRVLEECQVHVFSAGSGPEALERYKQHPPDVLVCDIGMPDMDGYSLIREVRRIERGNGRRVPALALTAFARAEDRQQVLQAGYDGYLSKPVDPINLINLINALRVRRVGA